MTARFLAALLLVGTLSACAVPPAERMDNSDMRLSFSEVR